MQKKKTKQQELLRAARASLDITTEELATKLGVTLPTMRSWLLPMTSKAHRQMPETARLLLGFILKEGRRKKTD